MYENELVKTERNFLANLTMRLNLLEENTQQVASRGTATDVFSKMEEHLRTVRDLIAAREEWRKAHGEQ